MYIRNASFCIGEASTYREPDMYLCSLVEKIALAVVQKRDADFREAGAEATCRIPEEWGLWCSALRTCRVQNGPYDPEAPETRPDSRKYGYASQLLAEVPESLKREGPFRLWDCVGKKNTASLKTHAKCGFQIVSEPGYDSLHQEANPRDFRLAYRYPAKGEGFRPVPDSKLRQPKTDPEAAL